MNIDEALELLEVRISAGDSTKSAADKAARVKLAAQKSMTRHILDMKSVIESLRIAFDDDLALKPAFQIKALIKSLEREVSSFDRSLGKAFRSAK